MPVPGFQTIMLPILKVLSDGREYAISQLVDQIANDFKMSEEDRQEKLPSGQQTYLVNRVGWARTYLKKAGLLSVPRRGYAQITDEGRKLLAENLPRIDLRLLERYKGFVEFRDAHLDKTEKVEVAAASAEVTPEEAMERAHIRLRSELEDEILRKVKGCSPDYFENLVVRLLVAMGYGGSMADAGKAVGRSGDGGIDGIIKEDKLGLDAVYLQAKRWESGTVGRPEIQKFVGALAGQKANKGVFLTTSAFTPEAVEYARNLQQKVILVDGRQLAELMIDHDLGVSLVDKFEIKRIDNDFFEED